MLDAWYFYLWCWFGVEEGYFALFIGAMSSVVRELFYEGSEGPEGLYGGHGFSLG